MWWLHVGKHKADEVNEAQKLIDALIILNETLTEFSNESHRLVTTLSRHIVTNIKQTPKLPITSRNRNTPVTSFDMLYYYRAKTGKSVTLKQLGLFNTVRELVKETKCTW
ncbi:hypothetical protein [Mannheimia haemolytica]|uniref:hypothetical protein n=1 Tax=Mannheimia haemolytica TaxID=75985 RepID=UPI0011BB1CD9|nr:hypothetical protein [Mannheimia haemolytica]QEA86846.1 hypothetical protein BG543_08240 [Mannheimia haemolytica]